MSVYRELAIRVWQESTKEGRGWAWAVTESGTELRRGWTNVSYEQATKQAEKFIERYEEGGV